MPASVANRGPKVICNGMEVIFKDVKVTGVQQTATGKAREGIGDSLPRQARGDHGNTNPSAQAPKR